MASELEGSDSIDIANHSLLQPGLTLSVVLRQENNQ